MSFGLTTQHRYRAKTRYAFCPDCAGETCVLTDYLIVWGFGRQKRTYKTLIFCAWCKRYWSVDRNFHIGKNSFTMSLTPEVEVSKRWVESAGF